MDVTIVEAVIDKGDVLVTFSDGKVSICKAEEVYKFALTPEVLMTRERLPEFPL